MARSTRASAAPTESLVHNDVDYDLRAGCVLLLLHTLICAAVGYYFGYIAGLNEGSCRVTCEEATAGQGSGHSVAGECSCTIIDTAGEKTTWPENSGR